MIKDLARITVIFDMQPLECGVVMQDNESLTQFVKK
jgi:hypothetical protein